LFEAKEIKRELLASDELRQKDPLASATMEWEWQDNFDKEKHVYTFRVACRCKHCGHEWNDLIQEK
jgi:hypothetical protein